MSPEEPRRDSFSREVVVQSSRYIRGKCSPEQRGFIAGRICRKLSWAFIEDEHETRLRTRRGTNVWNYRFLLNPVLHKRGANFQLFFLMSRTTTNHCLTSSRRSLINIWLPCYTKFRVWKWGECRRNVPPWRSDDVDGRLVERFTRPSSLSMQVDCSIWRELRLLTTCGGVLLPCSVWPWLVVAIYHHLIGSIRATLDN